MLQKCALYSGIISKAIYNSGEKIKIKLAEALPKNTLSLQGIPLLEKKVTEDLIARQLIKAPENV